MLFQRPHSRISEIIEGDEDEDTPEGSLQSSDLDPPYRTLSSSLRRFGTLASLDHLGSEDPLEEGKLKRKIKQVNKERLVIRLKAEVL